MQIEDPIIAAGQVVHPFETITQKAQAIFESEATQSSFGAETISKKIKVSV